MELAEQTLKDEIKTRAVRLKALEEIERTKEQPRLHNLQNGNPSPVGRFC